jgi:hypothetical protein
MRRILEDYQMSDKLILIGGAIASAVVSVTIMWLVWTGIFWIMGVL